MLQSFNNYFPGTITGRKKLLSQNTKVQLTIIEMIKSFMFDNAVKIEHASKVINHTNDIHRALDGEVINEERNLFNN